MIEQAEDTNEYLLTTMRYLIYTDIDFVYNADTKTVRVLSEAAKQAIKEFPDLVNGEDILFD